MHTYTHAIVGKVSPPLRATDRANMNDARRQYDCYLRTLKELDLELIELETDAFFPENILLEDFAVVTNGTAILPRPISVSEEIMMDALKKVFRELDFDVLQIRDPETNLAGSDVLFTGREFFVGISDTTNEAGACAVAEAFPEYSVTPIKMAPGCKNLKRYFGMAGRDLLCVAGSKEVQSMLKKIERASSFSYNTLTVPENGAANCLYVNGVLVHRAIEEIPESFKVFCDKIDYARRSVCFSALARVSTGLSACCILIKKF